MKSFDVNSWSRKEQYLFFKEYDDPIFGVVAEVEITNLFRFARKKKISFFLGSLYCSNLAVNDIENFRLRFNNDEVVLFDQVQLGSTILKEDKSFTFCYLEMKDTIEHFCTEGRKQVDEQLNFNDFNPKDDRLDIIYYSVLPWIRFSAIKHPSKRDSLFSIPQIVFGKYFEKDKRIYIPVSVEVNHALMDGYHVGQYFELFQKVIDGLV